LPVLLVIDDTLQEKFGIHFECIGKLFDYAKHNGSNYMNGHCFIGLVLKIPVRMKVENIYYLTVSSEIGEVLKEYMMANVLCDSW
jgi:hypothetical protein